MAHENREDIAPKADEPSRAHEAAQGDVPAVSANPPPVNPYSAGRVLASIRHLVLGKAVASVAGIGTLFLVVRGLSVEQFGAYSVMFGLVEVLSVLTTVGIGQILNRYVPELHAQHFRLAIRRLLKQLLGLRFLILAVVLAVILLFLDPISALVGLGTWSTVVGWYLIVVFGRSGNMTMFSVLESMLHQRSGQTAFASITIMRFIGVLILMAMDSMNLPSLILTEIVAEVIGFLLMGWFVMKSVREEVDGTKETSAASPVPAQTQYDWLRDNRRRMVDYGLKGYFQHLILMPFSSVVNRLVIGGSHLPQVQVAQFGFAQSILDLMERYLPAQLFIGVIRPVMVARFSESGSVDDVNRITNTSLKINLALIGLATMTLLAGGEQMLLQVTNGKYGSEALNLLLLMCLLVALDSWRHVLDVLSQVVERYGFLIFSNAVLGLSLVGGLMLLPTLGIAALPVANCGGLLIANLMVRWWLGRSGIPFRHELGGIAAILATAAVCAVLGWWTTGVIEHWIWRVAIVLTVGLISLGFVLRADSGIRRTMGALRSARA